MPSILLKTRIPGPRSQALAARRAEAVPRAVSQLTPIFVSRSEGAVIEDVDGNRYLDFAGGIGCLCRRASDAPEKCSPSSTKASSRT